MSIKPIIMQAESVRAILAGRKTQTRRVVKPQPINNRVGMVNAAYCGHPDLWLVNGAVSEYTNHGMTPPQWKSHYQPGDILYVKEGWFPNHAEVEIRYRADGVLVRYIDHESWFEDDYHRHRHRHTVRRRQAWRSPLHMPRWAARLWLKVTDVRAERLQDITEAEAKAEGIVEWTDQHLSSDRGLDKWFRRAVVNARLKRKPHPCVVSMRDAYSLMWDIINAKRGYPWESNPWVFVYTFETTNQPEHTKESR